MKEKLWEKIVNFFQFLKYNAMNFIVVSNAVQKTCLKMWKIIVNQRIDWFSFHKTLTLLVMNFLFTEIIRTLKNFASGLYAGGPLNRQW
jgi:hypothetical protein